MVLKYHLKLQLFTIAMDGAISPITKEAKFSVAMACAVSVNTLASG